MEIHLAIWNDLGSETAYSAHVCRWDAVGAIVRMIRSELEDYHDEAILVAEEYLASLALEPWYPHEWRASGIPADALTRFALIIFNDPSIGEGLVDDLTSWSVETLPLQP